MGQPGSTPQTNKSRLRTRYVLKSGGMKRIYMDTKLEKREWLAQALPIAPESHPSPS